MPRAVPTHRPRPTSTPERHRHYDRTRRDQAAKAFYHTPAWHDLRLIQLAATPYCERCLEVDRLARATVVHHTKEIREAWELRLDPANLESLCRSCHSRLHRQGSMDAEKA